MFFRFFSLLRAHASPVFFWMAVVCISLAAGFLGGVSTQKTFPNVSTFEAVRPIILQDRTRGPQESNIFFADGISQVGMSMVAVYDDAKIASFSDDIANLPTVQSLRGYALALTTDGWLVTTIPIEKSPKSYRLMVKTGLVYSVDSVLKDSVSGVSFVKISAKNMRPIQFVKFADRPDVRQATLLTGWGSAEQILASHPLYMPPRVPADYIHSTQNIDKRILPERSFVLQCLPVVSDALEVIGCTGAQGIISFAYLQSALESILRSGTLSRSALSLKFIDLSQVPWLLGSVNNPQVGAYLQFDHGSPQTLIAVDGKQEILTPGDIITHIDDEVLDESRNLAEMLTRYQAGDSVSLKIRSKKGDRDIRIKL